ncbi:MAG: hypothetical protein F4181_06400 [Proteobacteria bacterium]|nr:hypothetical protein [Pseudomonadota bacterium]
MVEVGDELGTTRSKGAFERVWKLLNSNSIVLFNDGRDQRRAAEQLQQKLDVEIASRVYRARSYLKRMERSSATALNVAEVLRDMGPVKDHPYPMGVFTEYSDRSIESLLWELAGTLDSDGEERLQISAATDAARALSDIQGQITATIARDTKAKCRFIRRVYDELDAFELDRWKIPQAKPVVYGAQAYETVGCIIP